MPAATGALPSVHPSCKVGKLVLAATSLGTIVTSNQHANSFPIRQVLASGSNKTIIKNMFVQSSKSGVSDLHSFFCSQHGVHGVHGIWAKHLLWHWPQDVYRIFPAGFPSKGHDGRVVCNDSLRLLCLTPGHQNKFYQSMSGMPLYDLCVLVWKHLIFLSTTLCIKKLQVNLHWLRFGLSWCLNPYIRRACIFPYQ